MLCAVVPLNIIFRLTLGFWNFLRFGLKDLPMDARAAYEQGWTDHAKKKPLTKSYIVTYANEGPTSDVRGAS